MNLNRFESQMTRFIPSFAGFTEWTASIPKMYWDVKSQEQRIFGLCRMLDKVICYADMLGDNVDEIAKTLQDIEDGKLDPIIEAAIAQWFEDNQPQIETDILALQAALPITEFDENNTVKDAIDAANSSITTINDEIGNGFDSVNTVTKAVNDLNDAVTDLENLSFSEEIEGANAIIREVYDNSTYVVQGLCRFPYDNPIYTAVALQNGGNSSVNLVIYNGTTKASETELTLGHASIISYNDGKLYVTGFNENKNMYVVDVTNINNPGIIDTIASPNNLIPLCYYKDGKLAYMSDNWGGTDMVIYSYDMTSQEIDEICHVPHTKVRGLMQSITYTDDLDCFVLLESGTGAKITLFNSEFNKSIVLKASYNFILCDELECAQVIGRKLYFVNHISSFQGYPSITKVYTVFESDLYDSAKYVINTSPFGNERFNILVDDTASPVYDDGYNGNNDIGSNAKPLRVKYPIDLCALPFWLDDVPATISINADYTTQIIPIYGGEGHHCISLGNKRCAGLLLINGNFVILQAGSAFTNYTDWLLTANSLPVFVLAIESDVMFQNYMADTNIGTLYLADGIDSKIYLRDSTSTQYVYTTRCTYYTNGVHV